jgi:hypothetical protein
VVGGQLDAGAEAAVEVRCLRREPSACGAEQATMRFANRPGTKHGTRLAMHALPSIGREQNSEQSRE